MSIKVSFIHYRNYITWTRVKLPAVFQEFDMFYVFWLLFSFHYHCQLVKGQLQYESEGKATLPSPRRFLRACKSVTKFIRKHLRWSLFFLTLQPCLLKKRLQQSRCFPVNYEKFSSTLLDGCLCIQRRNSFFECKKLGFYPLGQVIGFFKRTQKFFCLKIGRVYQVGPFLAIYVLHHTIYALQKLTPLKHNGNQKLIN